MNLKDDAFTIVIPSCDGYKSTIIYHHLINIVGLDPEKVVQKDGTSSPGFSTLINTSIVDASTEIVIICCDRCMPEAFAILRILELLEKGFAFVGLYRFGFFGLKKQLMRKIGFLDENFKGGGYEDCDYIMRVFESNLSWYEEESSLCHYEAGSSRWSASSFHNNSSYFASKWEKKDSYEIVYGSPSYWRTPYIEIIRKIKEPILDYDIGPEIKTSFLTWKDSVLLPQSSETKNWRIQKKVKNYG